jgi:YbbR domain-containing protein
VRNLLLDNLPLKVVALILAVTLVIVKHEEEVALVTVEVPIRVIYPTDRVLVVKPEDMVKVTVEGRYADLDKLDIPPLDVQLSGFQGETYAFEPELFKVPPGLKVKDVRPPAMLVRLEEKVVADLPVKPDLFSEPQAGYLLTEVRLEPPRIALEGARSAVERLEAVMTQRIDLTSRNQSTTLEREADLAPGERGVSPWKSRVSGHLDHRGEGRDPRHRGGRDHRPGRATRLAGLRSQPAHRRHHGQGPHQPARPPRPRPGPGVRQCGRGQLQPARLEEQRGRRRWPLQHHHPRSAPRQGHPGAARPPTRPPT